MKQQKAEAKKQVETPDPEIEANDKGYIPDPELFINEEWEQTDEGRHFLTICKEEGLAF